MKKTKTAEVKSPTQAETPPPIDWQQAGYSGFEDVSSSDLGIPFLLVIQKGSPEVDRTHKDHAAKRIDGIQIGDVIHSLNREIIHTFGEDAMNFIPCKYQKMYVEWKPREQGGGFVKHHENEAILLECRRDDKNHDVLRNGNLIVTTAYFYGLYQAQSGEWNRAVISMTSTQLKKARSWLNLATGLKINGPNGRFTPPLFSHSYKISTIPESNASGSWMGWKILLGEGVQDRQLIDTAIQFGKLSGSTQKALPPAGSDVM